MIATTSLVRDQQLAARLNTLAQMAQDDGTPILPTSLAQCAAFFAAHVDASLPKLTVTPVGTLRARWIGEEGTFVALEWTGASVNVCVGEGDRMTSVTPAWIILYVDVTPAPREVEAVRTLQHYRLCLPDSVGRNDRDVYAYLRTTAPELCGIAEERWSWEWARAEDHTRLTPQCQRVLFETDYCLEAL